MDISGYQPVMGLMYCSLVNLRHVPPCLLQWDDGPEGFFAMENPPQQWSFARATGCPSDGETSADQWPFQDCKIEIQYCTI